MKRQPFRQTATFAAPAFVLCHMLDESSAGYAQALMFNDDMVAGYMHDAAQFDPEYAYWRGMLGQPELAKAWWENIDRSQFPQNSCTFGANNGVLNSSVLEGEFV